MQARQLRGNWSILLTHLVVDHQGSSSLEDCGGPTAARQLLAAQFAPVPAPGAIRNLLNAH
ncbi:MAG: hypothetical protein KKF42_08250, partial [Actinobacteria bacterium]|nr:hypothetical protein [Actinomycetota bacterium]